MRLRRTPPRPPPSPIPARPARTMGQGAGIPYRRQSEQGLLLLNKPRRNSHFVARSAPKFSPLDPMTRPDGAPAPATHAGRRYHRAVQSGGGTISRNRVCRAGVLPAPRGCAYSYSYVLALFWLPRATPLGLASHPRWCRFTLYYDTLLPELIRILLKTVRIITTISSLRLPTYVKICFPPDSSQNGRPARPPSSSSSFGSSWPATDLTARALSVSFSPFLDLVVRRRPTHLPTQDRGSSLGICPTDANLFVVRESGSRESRATPARGSGLSADRPRPPSSRIRTTPPNMPGGSSNAVVGLALLLLPAGVRGQDYCGGQHDCDSHYCNGALIDGAGALVIPGNWTTVPDRVFYGCSALTSVSFSNSRVTDGDSLFGRLR